MPSAQGIKLRQSRAKDGKPTKGITGKEMAQIIEELICPECFSIILERFGGVTWLVPTLDKYCREKICADIYRLYTKEKWSQKRIAIYYKRGNESINNIIKKQRDLEKFRRGISYGDLVENKD